MIANLAKGRMKPAKPLVFRLILKRWIFYKLGRSLGAPRALHSLPK